MCVCIHKMYSQASLCTPDVATGFGECAAETGSNAYRGREDSSPEQHRRAGAEDQRPGQPDGGVGQRGRQPSAVYKHS